MEGAGGQSHPGETQHTLVVCCLHATEGADADKIAADLRTQKAGVTMVVVDTNSMALDLKQRLEALPAYAVSYTHLTLPTNREV